MPVLRIPLPLAFFLLASLPSVFAQGQVEISWGSSLFESKMIASDGSALDPANLIIEFGSFDNSFQPDHSNMSQWLTEWRVFDAITDTDPGLATTDSDPNDAFTNQVGGAETARYAGQAHLLPGGISDSEDATPFYTWSPGEEGYLFIRTSDDFVSTSEWLLLTSRNSSQHAGDEIWVFPEVLGGQPEFSLNWWLDDADMAVFGALMSGDGFGGDTGPGGFTDSSNDFDLRLHTIPEPRSPLLVLLAAALVSARRSRCRPAGASRPGS